MAALHIVVRTAPFESSLLHGWFSAGDHPRAAFGRDGPCDACAILWHFIRKTFPRFLCGDRQLRTICPSNVPSYDLSIVLEGLSGVLSEPLELVSKKFFDP